MSSNVGRGKSPRLGPGLFDPIIQLGPEDKWVDSATETSTEASELLVSRSELSTLFQQLDADADGRIDVPELLSLALSLGRRWGDTQAIAAMRAIDNDGDGLVSFDQFYAWYAAGGMSRVPEAAGTAAEAAAADRATRRLTREEAESIFQVGAPQRRRRPAPAWVVLPRRFGGRRRRGAPRDRTPCPHVFPFHSHTHARPWPGG